MDGLAVSVCSSDSHAPWCLCFGWAVRRKNLCIWAHAWAASDTLIMNLLYSYLDLFYKVISKCPKKFLSKCSIRFIWGFLSLFLAYFCLVSLAAHKQLVTPALLQHRYYPKSFTYSFFISFGEFNLV